MNLFIAIIGRFIVRISSFPIIGNSHIVSIVSFPANADCLAVEMD
jgi:hypothetical protein